MGRAKFDNAPNGPITGYDAESGTTATYDPNAPATISGDNRTNVTDEYTKRDRYRSMGEAAANAPAYQVDFGLANADRANGLAARAQQMQAANLMGQAAMGNAPSRAAIMGQQAAGQSLAATLGASAGARGMGAAAAQMQAQGQQAGMQLGNVNQFAGVRAGEMAQARDQFGNAMTGIRGGDYNTMGLDQGQADAQAKSEDAQRALNQAGQMGYEQMGINAEQQAVDSRLRQNQITANQNQAQADSDAARAARNRAAAQGIVTAVGAAAGASDVRTKTNAHYMLSDDRTKLARAWDEGHNEALNKVQQYRMMSPAELKQLGEKGNRLANAVRGAKADAYDEGQGRPQHIMEPPPERQMQSFTREQPPPPSMAAAAAQASREPTTGAVGGVHHGTKPPGFGARMPLDAWDGDIESMGPSGEGNYDPPDYNYIKTQSPLDVASALEQKNGSISPETESYMRKEGMWGPKTDALLADRNLRKPTLSDERTKSSHAEGEMGRALEHGLRPFEYEYKPEFQGAERQGAHEKNIGPMAQDMASNPITGTAIKHGDNGLLYIDQPKALKLALGGIGYLAAKQREMQDSMKKGGR